LNGISRRIPLNHGKFARVDKEDFDYLNQWKWYAKKKGRTYYAVRGVKEDGKIKIIYMHRLIMNPPDGKQVDHINGNGLDNRKLNLRNCLDFQNCQNAKVQRKSNSGYKGVSWDKSKKRYRARIKAGDKHLILGYFIDKHLAAEAYNQAAIKYFGEFARLNNIDTSDRGQFEAETCP